jgi:hypothetical protein
MQTKKLLAEIVAIAESKLKLLGFRKTKSIYVCPLTEDASGLLGLNTATHRGDGRVGINPVVGVRHERIQKMFEELSRESGLSATISISLGYLMPENKYLEWLFEPPPFDYRSECEKMVQAVELYGIPFMKLKTKLEDLLQDLEQLRFTVIENAVYRVPIAYLLSGKTEMAEATVKKQLAELETHNDLFAQAYKTFASKLFPITDNKNR